MDYRQFIGVSWDMFSWLRSRPSSKSLEASSKNHGNLLHLSITTHHQHPYPSNLWSNHIKSMLLFFPRTFLKSIYWNMPQNRPLSHFLVAVNMLPGRTEVFQILVLISRIACSISSSSHFTPQQLDIGTWTSLVSKRRSSSKPVQT